MAGPRYFTYQASGFPSDQVSYALTLSCLTGQTIDYPEPMLLLAYLRKELPVAGAVVDAWVTSPSGVVGTVEFRDDGVPPDYIAGDGFYSALLDYDENGLYHIDLIVNNSDGGAHLTYRGLLFSTNSSGGQLEPSLDIPISENFSRAASVQVYVQGVRPDDHGNSPAQATLVQTDNTPTWGRIEVGGDVDFFKFNLLKGQECSIRTSSLFSGMDSVLTVYRVDGQTVIKQDNNGGREGSSLVIWTCPADGVYYASVSHSKPDGTGGYLFTVGPRQHWDAVLMAATLPYVDAGGPYQGAVGEPITFGGGASHDPDGGEIVTYAWDWHLDSDLSYFGDPVCQHTWHSAYSGKVRLYVFDDEDQLDWAEAEVFVTGPQNWLWFILKSHADLHVYDPVKKHVGIDYRTGLLKNRIPDCSFCVVDAEGNEVPYALAASPGHSQMIGLPLYTGGPYTVKLVGTGDGPFELEVKGLQDGQVVAHKTYSSDIVEGEILSLDVNAQFTQGALKVECPPLAYPAVVRTDPARIELTVEPGNLYGHQLVIREVRGKTALTGAMLECAGITGPVAEIASSDVTFDVAAFDLAAGGEQVVNVSIRVPRVFMGKAEGSIVVKFADGVAATIPVVLKTAGKCLPVAYAGGPYAGIAGQPITFDAGASFDPDGFIDLYGWDWNADGRVDEYTSNTRVAHVWAAPFSGTVKLYVFDNDNMINVDTAQVTVINTP